MDQGASFDAKEQIRQSIDIVELASGYLQLRRQGRIYVAQCPWHDDSRPSLQLNPERQTFKCWVCDIGGDVFSFLMRLERLEFREALEQLAEKAGVDLAPAGRPATEPGTPGDRGTQLAAMQWALDCFHQCLLHSNEGKPARHYLLDRGISQNSIEKFRIGFSPNSWEWLVKSSHDSPFSKQVLERVGVVGRKQNDQGFYDRFKGRVIFPIFDVRSRPIAFGGRILPEFADDRAAKYINSPETPLYNKSDQLYALDVARDSISETGQAVVMEGYTDVIMAHQQGQTSAVAACGTALGERHLRLLRRFTERVVLVLDGDEAGQRRTNEVLEMFVANQVDLRILTLPEGLDPCDFLLSHGGEEFNSLLSQALDALEHKFRQIQTRVGSQPATHQASQAVEELLATLAKTNLSAGKVTSAALLREQQVLSRIASQFRVREEDVRSRLQTLRRNGSSLTRTFQYNSSEVTQTDIKPAATAVLSQWEQEILELVLSNPTQVVPIVESIPAAAFQSELACWFYNTMLELQSRQEAVTFDRLMALTENDARQNQLIDLIESAQLKQESDPDQRLLDLIETYRKRQEKNVNREQIANLREDSLEDSAKEELLNDFFDNLKRRQAGSLSTDG